MGHAMRWLLGLLILFGVTVAVVAGLAYRNARADPVVRRATVEMPDWPAGARPVTAVLISDIHIGSAAMDADRLTRIVAQIDALHPDIVLIAGDLIFGHDRGNAARYAPRLVAPLAGLKPRLGTIAVLGNHDWWTGAGEVTAALRSAGIMVLENQAVRVGPLAIGAIGDRMTHHDRSAATVVAMLALGGAPVILSHGPNIAPILPPGVPLLLAGHTHCGQGILFGRALGRQPYLRRYRCGIVRDGGRATIVTGGPGTSVVPFRIGAPPDLWLLTLGPRASS